MSNQFGPSGGVTGQKFDDSMPLDEVKISKVWGRSGARIAQIGVTWINALGAERPSDPAGGGGGTPFEYASGISIIWSR